MEGMVLLLGLNEVGDSRAWTAVNGGGKDWTNLQMQLLQQQHQTQGITHWQCYSAAKLWSCMLPCGGHTAVTASTYRLIWMWPICPALENQVLLLIPFCRQHQPMAKVANIPCSWLAAKSAMDCIDHMLHGLEDVMRKK
ncbi:unnamed protein product [Sphagnum jensenii]|uniref:Uncharacterized protein n=1 Tax=Sphagnum jensenii TaxID=128206 RepID=A0ABP0WUJ5_9BRYO